MDIAQRALRLKYNTWEALNSPMARLLPAPVLELFAEQAAVIAEMAESIRLLAGMMDLDAEDEHATPRDMGLTDDRGRP